MLFWGLFRYGIVFFVNDEEELALEVDPKTGRPRK